MNTLIVGNDLMLEMLRLPEFQNPLTGLNFWEHMAKILNVRPVYLRFLPCIPENSSSVKGMLI